MSVWSWLKLSVCLWLLRKMIKGTGWLLLAGLAVAVWPVTAVAVTGYVAAWLRGWPPVRLGRVAAAALPLTVIWLGAEGARHTAWQAIALAPVRDWAHGWHHLTLTGVTRTFLLVAPVAIPVGLGLAALAWGWRIYALTTGIGGWLASAPITFDARQWKHQVRTARGRTAAPGSVPLLARGARIGVGGTIRAIGHRWHPVFTVPHAACARHMVIVGATGSGKTNLMMRLWAGWFTAALAAARPQNAGRGHRPLLVVLDCKGGPDARTKANRTRRLLYGAGARRVAIWPDEARLSLWNLPPNDLAVLLYQMIDSGTGAAAYYADILQAVLTLAIMAPGGPPLNAAAFTDRLDVRWLQRAWGDGRHAEELARVRGAARHLPDIQLRFATLLGRLGPALDGPGTLADADAWYFILEGTREPSVAEAQAMAITELAAHAATDLASEPRAMLLAADDYSAVSRRVPLSNLYERGRSLGIGVQVSAQTWQGLGRDEDERYRIAATADGGIFLMHTPHPEPLAALAGQRRVLQTAHEFVGATWGDRGTTREGRAWNADPDLIRRLQVGQACYIHRGAATFVQVARPVASPLGLLPARVPVDLPAPRREAAVRGIRVRADPGQPQRCPRTWRLPMAVNPFDALGLPARPDLTDEQVRAAWRAIAAATHPDRPGGGDVARYTAATAAYAVLRTPWGRSEAFADLGADDRRHHSATRRRCRRPGARRPAVPAILVRPAGGSDRGHGAAARPDPSRPPAAPGHPGPGRRAAVPGRAGLDPRPARRAGASDRPDYLVPAYRPLGPGTPAVVRVRTKANTDTALWS